MNRRQARQVALRAIYQMDVGGQELDRAISFAAIDFPADSEALRFARNMVMTAWDSRQEIDEKIKPVLKRWGIERLPRIDLGILRLALAEINAGTAPQGVIINEAVELAKEYSTEDSGKFINGVLGALTRAVQ